GGGRGFVGRGRPERLRRQGELQGLPAGGAGSDRFEARAEQLLPEEEQARVARPQRLRRECVGVGAGVGSGEEGDRTEGEREAAPCYPRRQQPFVGQGLGGGGAGHRQRGLRLPVRELGFLGGRVVRITLPALVLQLEHLDGD